MSEVVNFNFPTAIKFGADAINLLPSQLKENGLSAPMVITDSDLVDLAPYQSLKSVLQSGGIDFSEFHDFKGNPVKSQVERGVEAYLKAGAQSMIIIGGGAALDVGKAIAVMVHHDGDLFDYEDGKEGAKEFSGSVPFIVAIPTTAGTGSEVGRSSVISDDETKAKKIIFTPKMLPGVVIADPNLTTGLPPAVTAATGMDALTHCIEAFLAKGYHPICDGIALEGIKLVSESLVAAFKDGENIAARGDMLAASMMGAIAFQKGLGVTHSCAHALSTVFDLHHGLANSMMLNACLEFNRDEVPERFIRMAQVVETGRRPEDFIVWVQKLREQLGQPAGLEQLGVQVSDQLIDTAFADVCHAMNPRTCKREDFASLYFKAM